MKSAAKHWLKMTLLHVFLRSESDVTNYKSTVTNYSCNSTPMFENHFKMNTLELKIATYHIKAI